MKRERLVVVRRHPALDGDGEGEHPCAVTQELLGWKPAHPGLIEDIEQGHYFIWNFISLAREERARQPPSRTKRLPIVWRFPAGRLTVGPV
jgi:hypothetical protein